MMLFWVSTKDHDEDWFVVARSATDASRFFERIAGYDPGDAIAELVMEIPADIPPETGWPPDELLVSLGADFVYGSLPRVVEISGKRYVEGTLESQLGLLDDEPC